MHPLSGVAENINRRGVAQKTSFYPLELTANGVTTDVCLIMNYLRALKSQHKCVLYYCTACTSAAITTKRPPTIMHGDDEATMGLAGASLKASA